jgi:acyl carrier protein
MTDLALSDAIAAHIETAAFLAPGDLVHTEPLFSAGIIDSVNLLELVVFAEGLCKVKVPPEDIRLEHWDSVEKIVSYLARRRAV